MSDRSQYCTNRFDDFIEEKEDIDESPNSIESDELLVHVVRAYPHLYDQKSKDFKDINMKENSWREIAMATNMTVKDCQSRWTRLRERFGKEKRLRETDTRSGSGATRRASFPLFQSMIFMENHIKRRKKFTNYSNVKPPKETTKPTAPPEIDLNEAKLNIEPYPEENSEFLSKPTANFLPFCEDNTPAPSLSGSVRSKKSKPDKSGTSDIEKALTSLFQSMTRRINGTDTSCNEVFGAFVGKMLDILPDVEANKRRLAITQILHEPV